MHLLTSLNPSLLKQLIIILLFLLIHLIIILLLLILYYLLSFSDEIENTPDLFLVVIKIPSAYLA